MNGDINTQTERAPSYAASRERGFTPDEFKKFSEARRRSAARAGQGGVSAFRSQVTQSGANTSRAQVVPNSMRVKTSQIAPEIVSERGVQETPDAVQFKSEHKEPNVAHIGIGQGNKNDVRPVKGVPCKTKNKSLAIVKKSLKTAEDWIAVDGKEYRVEGKRKKLPVSIILMIITLASALLLIVAGSVIAAEASMELSMMKEELADLNEYKAELQLKLDIKNDLRYIDEVARTKLGMVPRDFARVLYIAGEAEDKVVIHDGGESGGIGLSTLLSALGIGN